MTTENDARRTTVPSVPPVPPPPARPVGSVHAPAGVDELEGDGVRAGAVKAARAALAAAKDAAKRVQAVATGEPDVADANAPAGATPPPASAPRPAMHYTAGPTRLTPDGRPVPGAPGGAGGPGGGQPAPTRPAQPSGLGGPRRVRLTVSRVDPWSVMKLAFLLAVAIGIMTVVAAAVFWFVIDGLGVFSTIQTFISEAVGQQTNVNITQYVAFDRLVSLATLIAIVNIVLLTAIATITAILYNITAALVGGVHVTLTDD
ncbi:MAG: DUF3566 domain-containing protein [Promicromonosporaceae bacterium]|nr:DUF3566 domain-containing protein [Promicromonosporaceae bacterium]